MGKKPYEFYKWSFLIQIWKVIFQYVLWSTIIVQQWSITPIISQPWPSTTRMLAWDRGKNLTGLSLSQFALIDMAVNKHWYMTGYMSSQILVDILESKGLGGNPGLALPFSPPKIEEKALGDSPSAISHVHIWRWRNVQKVTLSQILVRRQPWHGSTNMLAWDRGKSFMGLSLSQFTFPDMGVNKHWEGYSTKMLTSPH